MLTLPLLFSEALGGVLGPQEVCPEEAGFVDAATEVASGDEAWLEAMVEYSFPGLAGASVVEV